jgi:LuxR family transcriptional regulator, maltose regulon positive regulatory protein
MDRIKLQSPQTLIRYLERPHLSARLDQIFTGTHRLVLISAPAGFGKTTLAAKWARSQERVAWLTLDVEDNDVMSFMQYFTEAIRSIDADIGLETLEMIRSPQAPSQLVLLKALLHDLARIASPLCIILDDYQAISANPVREIVSAILDDMPSALRMVIISRSEPSLNLRRMRLDQFLIEIRIEDLRFTKEEATSFLHESMTHALDPNDAVLVNERVEGWPAGLQMAVLALMGREDVPDFLNEYSGSSHYLLDYLGNAVFTRQNQGMQHFLLKTSVLESVNAQLASAVMKTRPVEGYEGQLEQFDTVQCQAILEELHQSHMFLSAMDGDHVWFRFHQLFLELLRTRLHIVDHNLMSDLHLQAASWFQDNSDMREAINHVLQAQDRSRAEKLFEQYAAALLDKGDIALLGRWLKLLTEDHVRMSPWLCVAQGWVMAFAGRLTGLAELLDRAAQLSEHIGSEVERRMITAHILIIRGFLALMIGNIPGAARASKNASRYLPSTVHWVCGMYHWVRGSIARMQGHLDESIIAFDAMLKSGQGVDNIWMVVTAATEQGIVFYTQGNLRDAQAIFEENLERVRVSRFRSFGCVSRLKIALAQVLYERSKFESAMNLVDDAIEGNRFWKNPNNLVYAYGLRSLIQWSSGNFSDAVETMQLADQEMRVLPVMGIVSALLNAVRVKIWLTSGELVEAAEWAAYIMSARRKDKPSRNKPAIYQEDSELNLITVVRVLLAKHDLVEALELINELEPAALAGGRGRTVIHLRVLRAAVLDAAGQSESALESLQQALREAHEQDYVRLFLDEVPLIEGLLNTIIERGGEEAEYAGRLLSVSNAPKPMIPTRTILKPARHKKNPVIEPLSQREKEVLRLIAAGMTNHQIATQLVISTGTVKAHSANIYRKLAAGNRAQAVERAQSLKLLT